MLSHADLAPRTIVLTLGLPSYEVITTPTDVIMVMEYAGEELFNYIVAKGKGGVGNRRGCEQVLTHSRWTRMRPGGSSSR